ncbi:hypothetical protein [Burkholderia phage vB_BglM_WTB]
MSSTTIQTDENNDIFLPDGRNLGLLTGVAAAVQNTTQKCLMRKGEDLYDQTNGVEYLESIFSPQPDFDSARRSILDNILRVPDVTSVESLDITISGNTFNYVAQIVTIYGLQTIQGSA